MYRPDFENLKNVLLCRDKNRDKKYVPLIELHIDEGFKEKYLAKKPLSLEDEVRFSLEHCHDFILAAKGILKPAKTIGNQTEKDGMTWADEDDGLIRNINDLENYDWMDPAKEDYSVFLDAKKVLPQDMKIIATGGKIFTATWMLMSFNNFCISTIENPGLVKKVFSKVGQIQFEVFSKIVEFETVGAFAAVDDIAYTEGLMISADILRENVFPWYKKMGQICKKKNIPFIYHSDGRVWEIIDDLLDCGFNAIHPIEPKAMSIKEVQDKYKDRLCLLGNIEMDTLIRGSSKDVEKLVLNNLENIAASGFYACGSSNTITTPMPVENVRAMVDTVRKSGAYPIKIK
jgi:uroporphyrinogen decarboxylase